MSKNADSFLRKNLGDDFFESLAKVELWKPGTRTTVDHEEVKTALQIVPRTVMALLIRELSPMNIGETKDLDLFVGADAKLKVTKHERDVYSGEIEQGNKRVVDFKYRSLPGIGLIILSAFELYDMDTLADAQHREIVDGKGSDDGDKVQKLIDERLAINDLVHRVVDQKLQQRDAVNHMMLARLTEELEKNKKDIAAVTAIATDPGNAHADEYMRGMANGLIVADAIVNKKHDPKFVEAKKKRPLQEFLDARKDKKEFVVHMAKGETVDCPDCGHNVFNGAIFSGCICLGNDMDRKVFIKKSEDGIKVRFGKGWDKDNIEMLLDVLRKKNG